MAVLVNVHRLDKGVVHLKGEATPTELDLEGVDELIRLEGVVIYDVTVEKLEKSILAQGHLDLNLRCECARCLKQFMFPLELRNWTCHLPLEGEDQVPIVNDCVDLTPFLREDILLEFPQHPLCQPECGGLPGKSTGRTEKTDETGQTGKVLSDWDKLNKLKF